MTRSLGLYCNHPRASWDSCNEDLHYVHIREHSGKLSLFLAGGGFTLLLLALGAPPLLTAATFRVLQGCDSEVLECTAFPASLSLPGFSANQPFSSPQFARSAVQSTEYCRNLNIRTCLLPRCPSIHLATDAILPIQLPTVHQPDLFFPVFSLPVPESATSC